MTTKLQELFLSLFAYNEQTGELSWLKTGKSAGWIENDYEPELELDSEPMADYNWEEFLDFNNLTVDNQS